MSAWYFPWGCRHEKDWGFSLQYDRQTDFYSYLDHVLVRAGRARLRGCLTIGADLKHVFDALKGR